MWGKSAYLGCLFLLISFLTSCGGGSTGTGGTGTNSVLIYGVVVDSHDHPLSGARIIINETGDYARSDAQGFFSVSTKLPSHEVTFFVEFMEKDASGSLRNVAPQNGEIPVRLVFDGNSGTLTVSIVSITPRPTPTPSGNSEHTARPSPTRQASPSPTSTHRQNSASPSPSLPDQPTLPSPSPTSSATPGTSATASPQLNQSLFKGTLQHPETQVPIAGVQVHVVEIGLVVTTAPDGTFSFEAPIIFNYLSLEVRRADKVYRAKMSELPSQPVIVTFILETNIFSGPSTGPFNPNDPSNPTGPHVSLTIQTIDERS